MQLTDMELVLLILRYLVEDSTLPNNEKDFLLTKVRNRLPVGSFPTNWTADGLLTE